MTDLPAETVARLLEAATASGMGPVALLMLNGRSSAWPPSKGEARLGSAPGPWADLPINDHNAATLARALAWAWGWEYRHAEVALFTFSDGSVAWVLESKGERRPIMEFKPGSSAAEALAHAIRAWEVQS